MRVVVGPTASSNFKKAAPLRRGYSAEYYSVEDDGKPVPWHVPSFMLKSCQLFASQSEQGARGTELCSLTRAGRPHVGWNPASNSEAGGAKLRRENEIRKGGAEGGLPLNPTWK